MENIKKFFLLMGLIITFLTPCAVFALNEVQNIQGMPLVMFTVPVLSPDNEKISFDFTWGKYNKASADFAVLTLKNDETQIITKSNADGTINEYPYFSNDNIHILFRRVEKNVVGLFLINLKTLEKDVLVFDYEESYKNKEYIDMSYLSPIWLPLNDKVIYIKQRFYKDGIKYFGYLYDLNEKKERVFASDLNDSILFRYAWSISNDGDFVFYTKKDNEYNDVWLSDLRKNHDGELQLTKGYDVAYLKASPVKNEILFVTKGEDKGKNIWTLYILNTKTKEKIKLLQSNYKYLGFPSWSQDGTSIVYINDKNVINIIDVNTRNIVTELKINMETITFPLLLKKSEKIIFYHNYSSIWSIGVDGRMLKKIFPK